MYETKPYFYGTGRRKDSVARVRVYTAINIFLRQSIRENCIPFSIQREVPNADTIAAMREADDMVNHPEQYETFHSMEDLKRALEA